jgi:hypothetical protein
MFRIDDHAEDEAAGSRNTHLIDDVLDPVCAPRRADRSALRSTSSCKGCTSISLDAKDA